MSTVLPSSTPAAASGLRFLSFVWFAPVMGLSGLSLAWHRAGAVLGEGARMAGAGIGAVAALAFVLVAGATLLRARRHRDHVVEDLAHPVRHPFVAAAPVSLVLVATAVHAALGPVPGVELLWMAGALLQFGATLWVLGRWLAPGRWAWPSFTPVLFIPVVGNVVVPLAGVPLGHEAWSAAQLGVGAVLWPVVLALLGVRIGQLGLWPDRMLPSTFITIAPAAVIGLAVLRLGAPLPLGWALWGVALFFLCWSLLVVKRLLAQPFHMGWWGLSFPLAAFTALSLTLAVAGGSAAFTGLAMLALAVASAVIGWLALATVRGLLQGTLLVPEPQPPQPVQPAKAP
jgi:tellurite resistance protein